MLINVGGLEQMALLMDGALIGVNPHNGDLQWQVPFKADFSIAVSTPLCGPDNLLFVSSEYGGGAKVIELKRNGMQTTATELWIVEPRCGCITATPCASATRSISRAAARAARRS